MWGVNSIFQGLFMAFGQTKFKRTLNLLNTSLSPIIFGLPNINLASIINLEYLLQQLHGFSKLLHKSSLNI
jgi:hypothetical protein